MKQCRVDKDKGNKGLKAVPGGKVMQICITFYILFDTVEAHACTLLKLFYF